MVLKIATIIGARPQFIKAAMVSLSIKKHNFEKKPPIISEILIHTGQHYDDNMSRVFIDQLDIPRPHYNLEVGSGTHGQMTGNMLIEIENVLLKEQPDWVLVYGDTNSTIAGAIAAAKLHIPVAHVEAGLRSFNRRMPEEINRVLTDCISSLLFCPTDTAVMNLKKEGITNGVFKLGDVMYDAFLFYRKLTYKKSSILADLKVIPKGYCLATVHRQENTDDPERLASIFNAFEDLASAECPLIIPLHPRTRKYLKRYKVLDNLNSNVRLIPPLNYLDMVSLECNARVILTDSGGLQKESYFAKVPCVTLRDETEWLETVQAGANFLSGADTDSILKAFEIAMNSSIKTLGGLYGVGNASQKIINNLISAFVGNH